eukprot:TRINITY_DN12371_c0_g1_i1.p2 TRINITY_DN12371_c0_g1~~TRINITY_DN12371_c0_g1_i1.p2  ORF type:complete len:120 (+),score=31.32 TRINITY_DN12371_c0_g1_i1:21-380(+)
MFFFFFSSRRRHTRFLPVSWARRCVQETAFEPLPNINAFIIQFMWTKVNGIYVVQLGVIIGKCRESFENILSCFIQIIRFLFQWPVSYTHLTLPTKRIVQISVVAVSLKKKQGIQEYNA